MLVRSGAHGTLIGGVAAGAQNRISGNLQAGVEITGSGTANDIVAGNSITRNHDDGVNVHLGAHDITIGGTTPGSGNLIASNYPGGIGFSGFATGNLVVGNDFSINDFFGVQVIDSSANTIGGIAAGAGNDFAGGVAGAHQAYRGVEIASSANISVVGNSIHGHFFDGITIYQSTGVTIGGSTANARNTIYGNGGSGVRTQGTITGTKIQGNYIGTSTSGNTANGNKAGVFLDLDTSGATVGGPSPAERNIISGNNRGIVAKQASGNSIQGNYIGTNSNGDGALPNGVGVDLLAGSASNTIGGTTSGAGNLISGNTGAGILIREAGTSFNVVRGNLIGTNAPGSAAIPNGTGVSIDAGAGSNTIGGTSASARNVISGNTTAGVSITGESTLGNVLYRNRIGTDAAGTAAIPNGVGVFMGGGTEGDRIGNGTLGNGNVIRFNSGDGVVVDATDGSTQMDSIVGNSIDSNGGLGIALVAGGNESLPAPVIDEVSTGSQTTVQGSLDTSSASTDYHLELFASPDCDPSGAGEGRSYIGFVNVTTDDTGHAAFVKTVTAVPHDQAVTVTATSLTGERPNMFADTSEFSLCAFSQ
jgi:titin